MSLSSHFNEALHSIRQSLLFPLPAKAERKPRQRTPHPYADLPPAQRQFRVARMDRAIEVAIRRGRHDLAMELRRLKGGRG